MPEPTEILIVGTGALATLFGGRLAGAGYRVTLLGGWQPGVHALREQGVRIADLRGNEQRFSVRVVESPSQCRGARWAIVLVKSWQTERAAQQLAECLSADGLALTLQNGLGNYQTLERLLGENRVALGTTTVGATLLGPGLVKPVGEANVVVQAHSRLAALQAALSESGFKVDIVKDANSLLWSKLVVNSAINPLTALLGIQNGELLERPAARALMRALAQETAAVAKAEGVVLANKDPAVMAEEVARRTASNYSSMLQDVRRGAPTEIDAICGAIAKAGKQHGVPTPLNDACWQLVQALAQTSQTVASVSKTSMVST